MNKDKHMNKTKRARVRRMILIELIRMKTSIRSRIRMAVRIIIIRKRISSIIILIISMMKIMRMINTIVI